MRISVIIPHYNRFQLLCRAVESVLKQRFPPLELIIADDGSNDQSEVQGPSYWGKAVTWLSLPHRGVSHARNRGAAEAKGDWLAFLDSDDHWAPDKLARQVEFHQQNPRVRVSQTQEEWLWKGKQIRPLKKHRPPGPMLFRPSLDLCVISPSAVLLRQEIWKTYGPFAEELPACEDYHLWLKITAKEPVGQIKEPLTLKEGGRADQLSRRYPAMDRFRVWAIFALLEEQTLSPTQTQWTLEALRAKTKILTQGGQKRGRDLSWLLRWVTSAEQGHLPSKAERDARLLGDWA